MISMVNVCKEYALDDQTTVTPVNNINLEISRGEFVVIIGRSGSGKTTILNLAAGLVRPTSGTVRVGDVDLQDMADGQLSLLRGRQIGFVFQFPSLLPSLSILENVVMPTMFGPDDGRKDAYRRAGELLNTVGLGERTGAYPRQLSAGEQKRVVVARALVNRPQVLLADEPTSDLDEQTEQEMMLLLKEIHQGGLTIVMVTHSLELMPYATRVLKMERGRLSPVNVTKSRR